MTLKMGAFEALDENEMLAVDGGFTWIGFGGSVVGGAITGACLGAAVGGAGAGSGAVGGALAAGIGYCISDIANQLEKMYS